MVLICQMLEHKIVYVSLSQPKSVRTFETPTTPNQPINQPPYISTTPLSNQNYIQPHIPSVTPVNNDHSCSQSFSIGDRIIRAVGSSNNPTVEARVVSDRIVVPRTLFPDIDLNDQSIDNAEPIDFQQTENEPVIHHQPPVKRIYTFPEPRTKEYQQPEIEPPFQHSNVQEVQTARERREERDRTGEFYPGATTSRSTYDVCPTYDAYDEPALKSGNWGSLISKLARLLMVESLNSETNSSSTQQNLGFNFITRGMTKTMSLPSAN